MTDTPDWVALLPDGLDTFLAPVREWTDADPDELIPNYQLGSDGPTLVSVFCLYGDLLCEVSVSSARAFNFDFTRVQPMLNIRVKSADVKLGEGDDEVTLQSATFIIHHTDIFTSTLNYLGDNADPWLGHVRGLFGIDRLTS